MGAIMKDSVKTKAQLLNELATLRRRKERLERSAAKLKLTEKALREIEEHYRTLAEISPHSIVVLCDGKIVAVNAAGVRLLGGTNPGQIIGKPILDFVHPDFQEIVKKRIRKVMKDQKKVPFHEQKLIQLDGTVVDVEAATVPFTYQGKPAAQVVAREITERKRAENQIKASLAEKEVLLREIHHRVKNNMQIISSLLNLQAGYIKEKDDLKMIKDSQSRIRSMALIHEQLYKSQDFSRINFSDYVQRLAVHLFQFNQVDPNLIQLKMSLEDAFLDIQTAIPCGLILNELITNSLKHAFPQGRRGEIGLGLHPLKDRTYQMIVRDTGVGLSPDVDVRDPKSFGLQIVTMLVDQLEGKMEVEKEGGTTFKIIFKELKYKSRL